MSEPGKRTACTARVSTLGSMVESTMVNIKMTKKKATEFTLTIIVRSISALGKVENKMVKEWF